MTDAIRDGNHVPVALGVDSTDATSTLPFKINPVTGGLIIDATSTGVISGSGTSGQVAYFNGTETITSSANLAFDGTTLTIATAPVISSMTAGSVVFIGSSKQLQQDNSNFFFDDTNNQLLLGNGTASLPAYSFKNLTNAGLYYSGSGDSFNMSANGGVRVSVTAGNFILTAGDKLSWGSSAVSSPDTFLSRGGSGILYVANASAMTDNTAQIGDATHRLSNIFSTLGTVGVATNRQMDLYVGSNTSAEIFVDTANSTPANASILTLQRSDGTHAARTNNTNGDVTGIVRGQTWSGGGAWAGAKIVYAVDAAVVNNQAPSNAITMYTVPQNGSQTLALTIDSAQLVTIATSITNSGSYFKLQNDSNTVRLYQSAIVGWSNSGSATGTIDTAFSRVSAGVIGLGTGAGAAVDGTLNLTTMNFTGKVAKYNNVTTAGWGVPAVYGSARSTGQTGDVTSVATYTCGAADGSFMISCNANCTAFTAGVMAIQCTYTDETNTARTLVLSTSNITGTIGTSFAATGAFEGLPLYIRVKASTAITIKTVGTAWTGTYNVEGNIAQLA